jgi:hypothetical protein
MPFGERLRLVMLGMQVRKQRRRHAGGQSPL